MKKLFLGLVLLLVLPTTSSGYYRESSNLVTYDNTEYYYTCTTSYSSYYVGELLDIDMEMVVDFFGLDSYSFYDIEIFIRGEDYDGFTVFEDSHFSSLDIAYEDDGVVVEWDIPVTDDFPDTLYLLVSADFYEETYYGDQFYTDEWIDIATINIYDGVRPARNSSADFPAIWIGLMTLLLTYRYQTIRRKIIR